MTKHIGKESYNIKIKDMPFKGKVSKAAIVKAVKAVKAAGKYRESTIRHRP